MDMLAAAVSTVNAKISSLDERMSQLKGNKSNASAAAWDDVLNLSWADVGQDPVRTQATNALGLPSQSASADVPVTTKVPVTVHSIRRDLHLVKKASLNQQALRHQSEVDNIQSF